MYLFGRRIRATLVLVGVLFKWEMFVAVFVFTVIFARAYARCGLRLMFGRTSTALFIALRAVSESRSGQARGLSLIILPNKATLASASF